MNVKNERHAKYDTCRHSSDVLGEHQDSNVAMAITMSTSSNEELLFLAFGTSRLLPLQVDDSA